jgi:hypothetical protein
LILRLCREFHKLPSEVYKEDAELIRLLLIEKMGRRPDREEEEPDGE